MFVSEIRKKERAKGIACIFTHHVLRAKCHNLAVTKRKDVDVSIIVAVVGAVDMWARSVGAVHMSTALRLWDA